MAKPTIPQGTRDFDAQTVRHRKFIFNTIQTAFELFGFEPLETPSFENLETLMGKYGEEGDKLIFRILNNGLERPEKHDKAREEFEKVLVGKNTPGITERALRYDLTIPFARYVAMNQGKLTLPFKRFQMQPVWRADRPQKGRYREFYQCDADVVGSTSLLNELELAHLYAFVFNKLNIPVEIRINSRKILTALADTLGCPEKLTDITIAIDKLDKIGLEKVLEELQLNDFAEIQIEKIKEFLSIQGDNDMMIAKVKACLGKNLDLESGINELSFLNTYFQPDESGATLKIDFTLARGLNYYTGVIFEVKALGVSIGSIGGGGRYDNLTGLFGVPGIAGVGISFGVDRMYDVMEALNLFPETVGKGTEVLFFNLGAAESQMAYTAMMGLRKKGMACEIYPETAKMDKQFKYAEKKSIPYVAIIGTKEIESKTCNLKNVKTGVQETLTIDKLPAAFDL